MAMWAILSAPLLMSIDLRNVKPEAKALLQNDYLIRVNQEYHGIQGQRILKVLDTCTSWMSLRNFKHL